MQTGCLFGELREGLLRGLQMWRQNGSARKPFCGTASTEVSLEENSKRYVSHSIATPLIKK